MRRSKCEGWRVPGRGSSACQGRRQKQDCHADGHGRKPGRGTGVQGDGWAVIPLHSLAPATESSVWSQETGLGVPLLLLSSLHHTCTCLPSVLIHTLALGSLGYHWAGACGRSLQAGKLCPSPPHRLVEGTLGSRPRKEALFPGLC